MQPTLYARRASGRRSDAAIIDDPHYVNIGTVLDNADCFDATLFGYSRQEAESMDPQQRLFCRRSGMRWNMPVMPRRRPHKTGVSPLPG